ncbi:MAG: ribokinase [Pseudomonadota bacterium]
MITVFGSLNADYVFAVEQLARPGETVLGQELSILPGGKGGNQALAARRAGAKVNMVGALGQDGNADVAVAGLRAAGINLDQIARVDAPTGMASIMVDAFAENSIVVYPGANQFARATQIDDAQLKVGDTLVCQLEVPIVEIEQLLVRAKENGVRTILNLAPAQPVSRTALTSVDILIVNETELADLRRQLGLPQTDSLTASLQQVADLIGGAVISTLGAEGVCAWHGEQTYRVAALKVDAVDTVGAGDAFVGAFAAALDTGETFDRALHYGSVAGALTCTQPGAQTAMPELDRIRSRLQNG